MNPNCWPGSNSSNFEAQAENIPSDQVLAGILNEVKEKAAESLTIARA